MIDDEQRQRAIGLARSEKLFSHATKIVNEAKSQVSAAYSKWGIHVVATTVALSTMYSVHPIAVHTIGDVSVVDRSVTLATWTPLVIAVASFSCVHVSWKFLKWLQSSILGFPVMRAESPLDDPYTVRELWPVFYDVSHCST